MVYATVKKILKPVFKPKFKSINGSENLPEKGPYLIASNHIDFIDGFYIATALDIKKKHTVYFLAKTKNYWWTKATLPINPKSKEESINDAVDYLRQGKIICNFIEGKRNTDNHLKEGKTGIVRMALIAGVPVVPLGIIGPSANSFSRSLVHLILKNHRVIINIGKPLTFEKYTDQEITRTLLGELTHEVMKKIAPLCQKAYSY